MTLINDVLEVMQLMQSGYRPRVTRRGGLLIPKKSIRQLDREPYVGRVSRLHENIITDCRYVHKSKVYF